MTLFLCIYLFLRPHPPMYVSEPWHSLINPDDIDLPFMDKTIATKMS